RGSGVFIQGFPAPENSILPVCGFTGTFNSVQYFLESLARDYVQNVLRPLALSSQPVEEPPLSLCGCCVPLGLKLRQEWPAYRTSGAPPTCLFCFQRRGGRC
ncbi:MAG TPA: hypothetical protein VEC99_11720, partial [Clostridia bacterium]|nr:hypothetical protein [Clostridia bacterium]